MELIEKRIHYLKLLHLYGELLSLTQKEILIDYLEYDLSISEIAENRSISRAAVEDAIKKGSKKLDSFEQALHLKEKNDNFAKKVAVLREKFGNCKEIDDVEEAWK